MLFGCSFVWLGVGLLSCGVRNESDPALALLTDYLEGSSASSGVRTASAMGLGRKRAV
jgi:hypothetical protein